MKKILITGSSGFLGSRLALYFRNSHELLLPSHSQLNVCHEKAVKAYIEEHRPDVVLHCAALSNTWYCEQHPEESHKVNVQATVRLAKACKITGAKLIFMSSDQVYYGVLKPGALKEEEASHPTGIYGQHKLEAEQRALRNLPNSVGLRLTWMYDLPESPLKLNSNILLGLQKAYHEGSAIRVAVNDFRGVTNVWEVAGQMEKAFSLPGGIYNFGSTCRLNSFELHLMAARLMGLDNAERWILPDGEKFCHQPRNLCMDLSSIESHGIHFCESTEGIRMALERKMQHPLP